MRGSVKGRLFYCEKIMPKALITSGGQDWILVLFDYDEDLKNDLMRGVGQGNYRWNPLTRRWSYRRSFYSKVKDILEDYEYDIVDVGEYSGPIHPPIASHLLANPWNAVFDSIEAPLGHKLYKAIVLVVHPDRGGDTETMQKVNDAWASRKDQ